MSIESMCRRSLLGSTFFCSDFITEHTKEHASFTIEKVVYAIHKNGSYLRDSYLAKVFHRSIRTVNRRIKEIENLGLIITKVTRRYNEKTLKWISQKHYTLVSEKFFEIFGKDKKSAAYRRICKWFSVRTSCPVMTSTLTSSKEEESKSTDLLEKDRSAEKQIEPLGGSLALSKNKRAERTAKTETLDLDTFKIKKALDIGLEEDKIKIEYDKFINYYTKKGINCILGRVIYVWTNWIRKRIAWDLCPLSEKDKRKSNMARQSTQQVSGERPQSVKAPIDQALDEIENEPEEIQVIRRKLLETFGEASYLSWFVKAKISVDSEKVQFLVATSFLASQLEENWAARIRSALYAFPVFKVG